MLAYHAVLHNLKFVHFELINDYIKFIISMISILQKSTYKIEMPMVKLQVHFATCFEIKTKLKNV